MKELELIENIKTTFKLNQMTIFSYDTEDYVEKIKRLDSATLKTIYLFIMSEDKDLFSDLSYFLDTFRGNSLENYFDPIIQKIHNKAKRVRREIHRMKGLLRFREIEGGYLYAQFCPENNIILPVANHFSNRLKKEKVLIHDLKRNILVFCYNGRVYPAKIESKIPSITQNEKIFSKLWLQYFDKISIKERMNLKVQKQKVPLKYRNSVIEFIESRNNN